MLDDRTLDHLIRTAYPTGPDDRVLPGEDAVRRYLLGTASASERRVVRQALEESSAFRRELLELAEAVDGAFEGARDAGTGGQTREPRQLPEWLLVELPNGADNRISPEPARRLAKDSYSRWDRWHLPITGPILVAALLVLLIVARSPHQVPGIEFWDLVSPAVEKEELISMVTRSGGKATEQTYTSARDAAVAAFRSALMFQNGEFAFRETAPGATPSGSAELVTTDIVAPDGSRIASLRCALPAADHLQVWMLSLPQRSLRHREFSAGMHVLSWDPAWGRRICVTWTYIENSHFRAGQVYTLEF